MTTTSPGTTAWTTEGGREKYTIGGLIVYITPAEAAAWNRGEAGDPREYRCHLPTHQPDRYSWRRDEMIAGTATDWYGTIGDAIADGLLAPDYIDAHMAGEPADLER